MKSQVRKRTGRIESTRENDEKSGKYHVAGGKTNTSKTILFFLLSIFTTLPSDEESHVCLEICLLSFSFPRMDLCAVGKLLFFVDENHVEMHRLQNDENHMF